MRSHFFIMRIVMFGLLGVVACHFAGCGYRLAGSGAMPGGIGSVCVVVFENRTSRADAGSIFSNSLVYEFTRRSGVDLVGEAEAEARLTGVVVSLATDTITHRDRYAADEMRVRAVLDVQLVSRGGEVLWSVRGLADRETYEVAGDAAYLTEESKKAAIMRLSEKMAETIYNRMTADF
ncbi:LPS assembly lipoprotein LptE [Desulfosudis oleivorans]|uniref:Uncharacterized protein n=1 Tax=Desulfosudis oleivorans (strain DSM 6200 / JCM 39069 / Hxd3) TaxID=96561 RepID=A8ZVQ4_DESOH|nr:LPS assembly lipoprotein LptE [Desulfosudis oleivorans]ABW68241.1 hypothetical protein Dole_2437 [Desulfosudis oleivorans Hxd3]